MGRSPCGNDVVKKGPWTPQEDQKLLDYIAKHGGHGSWISLPNLAGLNRCGKSCRLRWTNYLRPDIKRGNFSEEEQSFIISLHSSLGNKWSKIATHLPGRTDNEIKNYWNTHLRKKLLKMGIDPRTHRPRTDINFLTSLSLMLPPSEENIHAAQAQYLHNMLQHQANPVPNCNTSDDHLWDLSTGFGSASQELQIFDEKLSRSWNNLSGGAEGTLSVPGLVCGEKGFHYDNNWQKLLDNETSALFWEDIMHYSLRESYSS